MQNPAKELLQRIHSHPWTSLLFGQPNATIRKEHPYITKSYYYYFKTVIFLADIAISLVVLEIFLGFFLGTRQYITRLDIVALIWAIVTSIVTNKYFLKIVHRTYKHLRCNSTSSKNYFITTFNRLIIHIIFDLITIIGCLLGLYLLLRYTILIFMHPVILIRVAYRTKYLVNIIFSKI